jgi:ABC-type protease/lipase transport system fused ATPase/permease subunit
MKFGMDFSLIIGVLVLLQLYILNMAVGEKPKAKAEELLKEKNTSAENTVNAAATEAEEDLYFVVHRNNGEEKVYAKKDVA